MKSRGVYETPAGTILHKALRELERITIDFDTLSMKNTNGFKYAELVYAGKWYTHFRESMDAYMETASQYTTGSVRIVLYKGNVITAGRKSQYSLYIETLQALAKAPMTTMNATGFINLYGLSTGVAAMVHQNMDMNEGPAKEMKAMAGFSEK